MFILGEGVWSNLFSDKKGWGRGGVEVENLEGSMIDKSRTQRVKQPVVAVS